MCWKTFACLKLCVFFAEANNNASVAEDTRKIRGRCLLEGALIWDQYREQHWEPHWRQYRQHHREQGTPNPGRPTIIQSNQDHQLFVLARKARASASARLRSHPGSRCGGSDFRDCIENILLFFSNTQPRDVGRILGWGPGGRGNSGGEKPLQKL